MNISDGCASYLIIFIRLESKTGHRIENQREKDLYVSKIKGNTSFVLPNKGGKGLICLANFIRVAHSLILEIGAFSPN